MAAAIRLTGAAEDVRRLISIAQDPCRARDQDVSTSTQMEAHHRGGKRANEGNAALAMALPSFASCVSQWHELVPYLLSPMCCPRGISVYSWMQIIVKNIGDHLCCNFDDKQTTTHNDTSALTRVGSSDRSGCQGEGDKWYANARIALMLMYVIQTTFHRTNRLSSNITVMDRDKKKQFPKRQRRLRMKAPKQDIVEAKDSISNISSFRGQGLEQHSGQPIVVPCYVGLCVMEGIEMVVNKAVLIGDDDVLAIAAAMVMEGDQTGAHSTVVGNDGLITLTSTSRLCVGAVCPHGFYNHRSRMCGEAHGDMIPLSETAVNVTSEETLRSHVAKTMKTKENGEAREMMLSPTKICSNAPHASVEKRLLTSITGTIWELKSTLHFDNVRVARNEYEHNKRKRLSTVGQISGINTDAKVDVEQFHTSDLDATRDIEKVAEAIEDKLRQVERDCEDNGRPGATEYEYNELYALSPRQLLKKLRNQWCHSIGSEESLGRYDDVEDDKYIIRPSQLKKKKPQDDIPKRGLRNMPIIPCIHSRHVTTTS